MDIKVTLTVLIAVFVVGCASVPMESSIESNVAKKFDAPASDNAGLYIYRSGSFGAALKKDLWVDGKCIGETARNVFFYEEVEGGKEHKISTESEFSPNELMLTTESGRNYFVRQYIKFGLVVGGAGLMLIDELAGKTAIEKLEMAKKGNCSNSSN